MLPQVIEKASTLERKLLKKVRAYSSKVRNGYHIRFLYSSSIIEIYYELKGNSIYYTKVLILAQKQSSPTKRRARYKH